VSATGFLRIACRGAPRDLGLDQGSACAREIGRVVSASSGGALARVLGALRPPAAQRAVLRDTYRHFPHMAERAAGLARGAGVSPRALAARSANPEQAPADALRLVRNERGPCVARALPPAMLTVLRESAPDTGYRSLELVALERVAPWVGVNEHGLAVGAVLHAESPGDCAAPASLLVQDCLQRFDRVEKALEWLERRPAGGHASFVLADAAGATAGLDLAGEVRTRVEPSDAPVSPRTAERSCIALADPHARVLAWTFADGGTGEAGFAPSA
jgi:hypothetical protein